MWFRSPWVSTIRTSRAIDAADLKSFDRIFQVVEHAGEQHDIETAVLLGRQFQRVSGQSLDLQTERRSRPARTTRVLDTTAPQQYQVGRHHPRGAASLRLEAVNSVPGSDVEDGRSLDFDRVEECRRFFPVDLERLCFRG